MVTFPSTFDIVPAALLQSAEDVINRIQTSTKNLLESMTVEQADFNNAIRRLWRKSRWMDIIHGLSGQRSRYSGLSSRHWGDPIVKAKTMGSNRLNPRKP